MQDVDVDCTLILLGKGDFIQCEKPCNSLCNITRYKNNSAAGYTVAETTAGIAFPFMFLPVSQS